MKWAAVVQDLANLFAKMARMVKAAVVKDLADLFIAKMARVIKAAVVKDLAVLFIAEMARVEDTWLQCETFIQRGHNLPSQGFSG